jgi:hypothetical protein
MRVRLIAAVTGLVLLSALAGLTGAPNDARARLQEASPEAETDGTPAAEDETVQVVTLVGWYQRDADSDILNIGLLTTNPALVHRRLHRRGKLRRPRQRRPATDHTGRLGLRRLRHRS